MIYIHNEYDEIVETFNSSEHMYKVMQSRYVALKNKRHIELNKAFNKGWLCGLLLMAASITLFWLIFQL